jgi:hypothetical protein
MTIDSPAIYWVASQDGMYFSLYGTGETEVANP